MLYAHYLRIAIVIASGDVAHGQIASGLSPWLWNKLRKASHEETDPGKKENMQLWLYIVTF